MVKASKSRKAVDANEKKVSSPNATAQGAKLLWSHPRGPLRSAETIQEMRNPRRLTSKQTCIALSGYTGLQRG